MLASQAIALSDLVYDFFVPAFPLSGHIYEDVPTKLQRNRSLNIIYEICSVYESLSLKNDNF